MTSKMDHKTYKKASVSSCFLNMFGENIGGTIPKKGGKKGEPKSNGIAERFTLTLCRAVFLLHVILSRS